MGKLKELWDQLKSLDDDSPLRGDIQKEINKLEEYCISKGFAGFTTITNWNNNKSKSDIYPWHSGAVFASDIWMVGELNGKHLNYNSDNSIHVCDEC